MAVFTCFSARRRRSASVRPLLSSALCLPSDATCRPSWLILAALTSSSIFCGQITVWARETGGGGYDT